MGILSRFRKGWNAFQNKDPTGGPLFSVGIVGSGSSSASRRSYSIRSSINSILNRIALDVSSIEFKHCKTDDQGRYKEDLQTGLNECLTLSANLDQSAPAFMQDVAMSMLDEGHVVVVPVDTTVDPTNTDSYDILTMRTGRVTSWYARDVTVSVYNENTGRVEDITISKNNVGIIESPLYAVINEPNSTLQRLNRTLTLLDQSDEDIASGKFNMIIRVPYSTKYPLNQEHAKQRLQEIEDQLRNSKYGIAYIDSTEKADQLNRPLENNLQDKAAYLYNQLLSQLGITQSILDGTADEQTLTNYYNRTVEPIVKVIAIEFKRKFISKTGRSQGHSICTFRDPFKLVPVSKIAEMSDKFTRNEICTSNEIRQSVGLQPSKDPKADELSNSNLKYKDTVKSDRSESTEETVK